MNWLKDGKWKRFCVKSSLHNSFSEIPKKQPELIFDTSKNSLSVQNHITISAQLIGHFLSPQEYKITSVLLASRKGFKS